ncbi:MAG: hypothetical protein JXJ22_16510 [Bacteroidales bacterium]|nr:hypothetical protein [Bacteroidales bacterium]
MKMAPGVFWGIVLVLIGLSIIFRILFDVSIFRIVFAIILISIGIKVLIGHHGFFNFNEKKNDVFFGEHNYTEAPKDNAEYNTIFAQTTHDFRNVNLENNQTLKVKVNTVFGKSIILVDENMPVKIKAEAVFAGARMPDGNMSSFGSVYYTSESFKDSSNYLYIEADVVFGAVEVVTR